MEDGLGEAVRLWDEDRIDGDNTKDAEMDLLEGYMVDALAEDETEEWVRTEDGIPRMSSAPPSRHRANTYAELLEGSFPHRPKEVL
jgi:hypothetical protein